jgi:hypothetical protein
VKVLTCQFSESVERMVMLGNALTPCACCNACCHIFNADTTGTLSPVRVRGSCLPSVVQCCAVTACHLCYRLMFLFNATASSNSASPCHIFKTVSSIVHRLVSLTPEEQQPALKRSRCAPRCFTTALKTTNTKEWEVRLCKFPKQRVVWRIT